MASEAPPLGGIRTFSEIAEAVYQWQRAYGREAEVTERIQRLETALLEERERLALLVASTKECEATLQNLLHGVELKEAMQRIDTNMSHQGPQPRLRFAPGFRYSRVQCSACGNLMDTPDCPHHRGQVLPDGSVVTGTVLDATLEEISLVCDE